MLFFLMKRRYIAYLAVTRDSLSGRGMIDEKYPRDLSLPATTVSLDKLITRPRALRQMKSFISLANDSRKLHPLHLPCDVIAHYVI